MKMTCLLNSGQDTCNWAFLRQSQSWRKNARRHKPFRRNEMNANNLWGSMGSVAGKFMSSFGNGVSKGMNATVAAVSDSITAINEEFLQDGEEHYFEEDRSVCEMRCSVSNRWKRYVKFSIREVDAIKKMIRLVL